MKSYNRYVSHLSGLVGRLECKKDVTIEANLVASALDGGATRALEELVDLRIRREHGIFFTHGSFSKKVVSPIIKRLKLGPHIVDPACGAGDLLIECARYLPTNRTLSKTLSNWGDLIFGYDIHKQLIVATKYRLVLAAIERGVQIDCSIDNIHNLFPNIKRGNALVNLKNFSCADVIITNPPYVKINVEQYDCDWGSGGVSLAGLFIDKLIENAKAGTTLVAVLPDVLRTGSSFKKWRNKISHNIKLQNVKLLGRFKQSVDIDVFILKSKICKTKKVEANLQKFLLNGSLATKNTHKVDDNFNIYVGPVVPHRNPNKGRWRPFLHARDLPKWKSLNVSNVGTKNIRFAGRVFKPPFVAVRRTSSPSDKNRAVATLILGKKETAVENHLIVLQPKKGGISACKELIRLLKKETTDLFLNHRIRCRHLTVDSVKEIPWKSGD